MVVFLFPAPTQMAIYLKGEEIYRRQALFGNLIVIISLDGGLCPILQQIGRWMYLTKAFL